MLGHMLGAGFPKESIQLYLNNRKNNAYFKNEIK
jgi:hypothetical protein